MDEKKRIKRNNFILAGAILFVIIVVLFIIYVFTLSSNNPKQVVEKNFKSQNSIVFQQAKISVDPQYKLLFSTDKNNA